MAIDRRLWLSELYEQLTDPDKTTTRAILRGAYFCYAAGLLSLEKYLTLGTNIYEREWDALIILDACRVDALRAVAPEYSFIGEVGSIRSVGSMTPEWMTNTFRQSYKDEIAETSYVVKNAFIELVLNENGHTGFDGIPFGPREFGVVSPEDFHHLERIWQIDFDQAPEWKIGTDDAARLHPRYITDRAIHVGRTNDSERLITHYIYPHEPYPLASSPLRRPFRALEQGEATKDEVWGAYLENLRFVLDDVSLLLNNLDADQVVITADHGEAFGEYGFYQHLIGCPIPSVRRVPWVETTATDSGTYPASAPGPSDLADGASPMDNLEDLGYL